MNDETDTIKDEEFEPSGSAEKTQENEAEAQGPQPAAQPLTVHAQYIKDLSFEAPSTPQIFSKMQDEKPNITVHVDVRATAVEAPVYEVVIHVKVECKIGEATGFILELAYGGIFSVNAKAEHVRPLLLIECPRMLFPFARQVVASTTTNGGFLPLMLAPVDFAALYRKQLQEKQAELKEKQAQALAPMPEENEKLV